MPFRMQLGDGKSTGPDLDMAGDAAELPVHHEARSLKLVGAVLLLMAAADLALALVLFVFLEDVSTPVRWLVPGLVALGAVVMVLIGLHLWIRRKEWEIAGDEVRHRWRGLFGAGEWVEPLSAYRGVLARQEYHSGGQNAPGYTLYILELKHETDEKRDVRLYQSRSREGFRARHEDYARLLGTSALIETQDGIEERRVEDLAKSVRELVAEGVLRVEFDATRRPPGRHLATVVEGDTLVVRTRPGAALGKPGLIVPLVTALAGAGMAVGGLIVKGGAGGLPLLLAGLVALVGGTALMILARRVRQELRVSPDEVRVEWHLPVAGEVFAKAVPAEEVESVTVRTPEGSSGFTMVQAVTDADTVSFGFGLTDEEKAWVRDCIITVISA